MDMFELSTSDDTAPPGPQERDRYEKQIKNWITMDERNRLFKVVNIAKSTNKTLEVAKRYTEN